MDSLKGYGFGNAEYLEEAYERYLHDPLEVDPALRKIFDELEGKTQGPVAGRAPRQTASSRLPPSELPSSPTLSSEISAAEIREGSSVVYYPKLQITSPGDLRVYSLIEAYRTYGHLAAKTNPIQIKEIPEPAQLNLEGLGFDKQDLTARFPTCGLLPEETAPLLRIISTLKSIYCDKIGVEYMGLQSPELEAWLQQHIEPTRFKITLSIDQKRMILQHLNKSELFESFLHTKYVGQKRFSLEGAETLIPVLAALIDTGAEIGFDEFYLGMAHRGRLNVLCNILDKSYADIFSEFEEGYVPASVEGSGDVKYHKGFYSDIKTIHGHKVKVVLTPNPSHLEAVDPVVEGQVRARQIVKGDDLNQEKVIPVLIHGDAAIAGQGVVYETLQLFQLDGYRTGGTIHIIINNQIGFTTLPQDGRSTRYCTDIARAFGAPVFHVNAEDPEGCVYATNLAIQLRQKFHCDVFIELNCYRKYGHNEMDEPAFTQPLEYQIIRKKKPIREIYLDDLIHQGVLEKYMAESLEEEFKKALQQALKGTKISIKESQEKKNGSSSNGKNSELFQHIPTGVPKQTLQEIGARICTVPDGFSIHPKLAILIKEREAMLKDRDGARPIDWGMAELLAYGSILWDGTPIRLTGQDTCRGTFSHRHAILVDQEKEQVYVPLKHLKARQGRFDIYNSPLSEFACLGFEFGYSIGYPQSLVLWEAQFGDFANGAQVIMDQFISTAEQKWGQKFSLTLLLPHGYEGQGPEHSSGRIERFLTLAGSDNMLISYPTTPAQFFHLLRRQALWSVKKPLIVFTPKGLLRHPVCVSRLEDLERGSFQDILDDPTPPKKAKKLVFCTGRVFYDLSAERTKAAVDDMAIIRIEQLYPLDLESLKSLVEKYNGFQEVYWVQEEPKNMGAWSYIHPLLREILPINSSLTYIGRARSASPAAGSYALHKKEYAEMINALFGKKEPSIFEIAGQIKA